MIYKAASRAVKAVDIHDGKQVCHITKRVLIGPDQGKVNSIMRMFTIGKDGCSPYHTHPWDHEVYVLEGCGAVKKIDGEIPLQAGDIVYVPAGEEHQFINTSDQEFTFLCLVPYGCD